MIEPTTPPSQGHDIPGSEGLERLNAEIAGHPKSALIDALADAMHSIEDDDGTGRHIGYYRSLAYATVEILPALFYDEDATCDEPGCGAHPGGVRAAQPPVTPAADLADEAAHERVARAIVARRAFTNGRDPDEDWADSATRAEAYKLARTYIDAYRAGQPIDMDGTLGMLQREAYDAIERLREALTARGLGGNGAQPYGLVGATIAHIDRLTATLDDAAFDREVEQEIRARALDAATRLGIRPESADAGDEAAAAGATAVVAARYVRFLTDGRPCTCLAETGAHPHTARGCDIEHCGCRWVPPPIDDTDEAWAATNGQRRYSDGYAEAVRRLRDDDRYTAWHIDCDGDHDQYATAVIRYHLAEYLGNTAPDPDDPWADALDGGALARGGSIAHNVTSEPEIVHRGEPGGADGH